MNTEYSICSLSMINVFLTVRICAKHAAAVRSNRAADLRISGAQPSLTGTGCDFCNGNLCVPKGKGN